MRHLTKISHWLLSAVLLLMFAGTAFSEGWLWGTLRNAPVRTDRHDDLFFVNPWLGWVVNGGGQIWKTTNAGFTWSLQFTAGQYLRSVGFADSLSGWVGTLSGDTSRILYHTTDGGASWSPVQNIPEPRPMGICGISVVNDSVVYASGRYFGPPRVIKTTDRGATWSSFDLSAYAGALVDCYFFSRDSGFVVGSSSEGYTRILFTSDGGNSWTIRHAGDRGGELCWKIIFRSKTTGYVSIENFSPGPTYYLKTTDGGLTWSDQLFQNFQYDIQGIGFAGDSMGWVGGWGGKTYETTDGGASWHLASFGLYINRIRFFGDTLAYAVGQTVYRGRSLCTSKAGDANGSGNAPNLSDIVYIINYLFEDGPIPSPECRGDVNADGSITFPDIVYLINRVFKEGPAPVKSGVCCL